MKRKRFYVSPTLVRFIKYGEDSENLPDWGIAYGEEVICLCCGNALNLNLGDVEILSETQWIDVEQLIEEKGSK